MCINSHASNATYNGLCIQLALSTMVSSTDWSLHASHAEGYNGLAQAFYIELSTTCTSRFSALLSSWWVLITSRSRHITWAMGWIQAQVHSRDEPKQMNFERRGRKADSSSAEDPVHRGGLVQAMLHGYWYGYRIRGYALSQKNTDTGIRLE